MWFAQIHHDRVGMPPYVVKLGCGLCFWATVNHEKHSPIHNLVLATLVYAPYCLTSNVSMMKCVKFTFITQVLMHSGVERLEWKTTMKAYSAGRS
jgi:hypothetical protein